MTSASFNTRWFSPSRPFIGHCRSFSLFERIESPSEATPLSDETESTEEMLLDRISLLALSNNISLSCTMFEYGEEYDDRLEVLEEMLRLMTKVLELRGITENPCSPLLDVEEPPSSPSSSSSLSVFIDAIDLLEGIAVSPISLPLLDEETPLSPVFEYNFEDPVDVEEETPFPVSFDARAELVKGLSTAVPRLVFDDTIELLEEIYTPSESKPSRMEKRTEKRNKRKFSGLRLRSVY